MAARAAMIAGFSLAVLLGAAAGVALTRADGWRPLTVAAVATGPAWGGLLGVVCLGGAVGLGLLTRRFTRALWGAAVAATALTAVGLHGGTIEGLVRVSGGSATGVYVGLAMELLVGAGLWLAGLWVIEKTWRGRLGLEIGPGHEQGPEDVRLWAVPDMAAVGSGLICAVVGAGMGFVLLRDPHPQQAVGGLLVAFLLGGLAAKTAYPKAAATGVLLGPVIVGLGAYGWAAWRYGTIEALLADLYAGRLLPLALAMPLHYIGAATLGCVLGMAWAAALAGDLPDDQEAQGVAIHTETRTEV
jgi:hypothetical protein